MNKLHFLNYLLKEKWPHELPVDVEGCDGATGPSMTTYYDTFGHLLKNTFVKISLIFLDMSTVYDREKHKGRVVLLASD